MKKAKRLTLINILLSFIVANNLVAQEFKIIAKMSDVKTNGLHLIPVTPEIRSFSKIDLSDVRIYDDNKNEVPYYIWENEVVKDINSLIFNELSIILKEIQGNNSVIIVENSDNKTIDQMVLFFANTRLKKILKISGGDDYNQWFGIVEDYPISNTEDSINTSFSVNIKLPKSNYKYFKIEINNKKNAPINLIKVGTMEKKIPSENLVAIKPSEIKIHENSSSKSTQIIIKFKNKQIIENIHFEIKNPKYFKRNARILVKKNIQTRNSKKTTNLFEVAIFTLNSNKNNSFQSPPIFEDELIIEIENQDSPALEIGKINFFQYPVFLVSELEANKNYTLKTSDSTLNTPVYDIQNFKEKTISKLPVCYISKINKINSQSLSKNTIPFWQKRWFLFVCISFVASVIGYFSFSLLKEINK